MGSAACRAGMFFSGGNGKVATPVPIPNTEVKHLCGDGTALERVWESSTLPGLFLKPGSLMGPGLFHVRAPSQ